jgi:hypothetical protein
MAEFFPTLDPGLGVANPSGQLILGTTWLAPRSPTQATTAFELYGFSLRSCDVEYAQELLGPWMNVNYQKRWKFLGYRPIIRLDFGLVVDDTMNPNRGLALLRQYHTYGLRSEEGYKLLFSPWAANVLGRIQTVYPTTPFTPKKAGGVQARGWELEMTLEAVDLVPASSIGDFRSQLW